MALYARLLLFFNISFLMKKIVIIVILKLIGIICIKSHSYTCYTCHKFNFFSSLLFSFLSFFFFETGFHIMQVGFELIIQPRITLKSFILPSSTFHVLGLQAYTTTLCLLEIQLMASCMLSGEQLPLRLHHYPTNLSLINVFNSVALCIKGLKYVSF